MSAAISYRLTVHGRKFVGTRLGVTSHYAVGVAQAECIMSMPVTQASRAIRDVATAFEHIDSWQLLEVTITKTTKTVASS